jgi:hypothetical protein
MVGSIAGNKLLVRCKRARRRWAFAASCVCALVTPGCNGPGLIPAGHRTIHTRVVVDPEIAALSHWQESVIQIFRSTNNIMASTTGVTFTIDTMFVVDIEKRPSYPVLLLADCLVKEIPRGKSDVVVFFSTKGNPASLIAGMTQYELGYAHIRLTRSAGDTAINPHVTGILVHAFAHMLGAVHCYYNHDNITVMNPFIHDGLVDEPKSAGEYTRERFHPGNQKIMHVMARRPFTENLWDTGEWEPIRTVYDDVRKKYNSWEIDGNGEIAGYESDAFHEGNLLLYLSSWSSLCGRPREALGYLDSLTMLLTAIRKTCDHEGIIGRTRLCSICGFDDQSTATWLALQMYYIGMRRSLVLLREGDAAVADSCFFAAIAGIPDQLAALKDKYLAGYRVYRTMYLPQAPEFSTVPR